MKSISASNAYSLLHGYGRIVVETKQGLFRVKRTDDWKILFRLESATDDQWKELPALAALQWFFERPLFQLERGDTLTQETIGREVKIPEEWADRKVLVSICTED